MKRNNLTTAVIAGIAGVAGIASVSNAVNLNSDGLGEVLIYPYYTVNNGLNTLISVVNTTDQVKAVKIRFLEGKNSRECLDFNLFLSPYDVWTSALVATDATTLYSPGHEGESTVQLITHDNSCTLPAAISGYEFLPWAFDVTSGYDGAGRDLERCTEGHFEMIEMGVVTDTAAASGATHVAGVPSCAGISGLEMDAPNNFSAPTGGLFGSASLIDVAGGVDVSYNADAINGANTTQHYTNPSALTPSLASLDVVTSSIFYNGAVQTDTWLSSSVQAISAVYMHNNIYGEYALTDSIGANTEWVVTFPTKNFYVDVARTPFSSVPYEPFTSTIGATGASEPYTISMWDREEQVPGENVVIEPPSPTPPDVETGVAVFQWETNVLEFEDSQRSSGVSVILGSNNTTHFITQSTLARPASPGNPAVDAQYFDTGWVTLNFAQSTDDNASGTTYHGLPVTGFAIQRYVNQNVRGGGGTLANYAGLFAHRYSRLITS